MENNNFIVFAEADKANTVFTGEILNVVLGENFTPEEINLNVDDLTTQIWSTVSYENTQRYDGISGPQDNR
jgi:hypothetical protein